MSREAELICINCRGIFQGSETLRPVISVKPHPKDGQYTYDTACVHKLPRLRKWRTLTDAEMEEWIRMSDELVEALKDASKSR